MNIYPSYKCNLKCDFCSFWKKTGKTIDLNWLEKEFYNHHDLCKEINILGGEPSILPKDYQEKLIDLCYKVSKEKPFFITNLIEVSPFLEKTNVIISYDFELRSYNKKVINNMLALENFSISTILTDNLVKNIGSLKYLKFIDNLKGCKRADLVLYRRCTDKNFSPNQKELMQFIKDIIHHPKINMAPYSAMLNRINNDFSNLSGRMGFFPDNKYGVRIDYKNNGYTLFDTYEESINYYEKRISEIKNDALCGNCKYVGKCWCVGGYESNVCHGNKEMMEFFEEYVSKYNKQNIFYQ